MLYTSTPLERVYYDHNTKSKSNKLREENNTRNNPEYKEVMIANGRIMAKKMGDKYVVDHINSTDMSDYLNENYSIGSEFKL